MIQILGTPEIHKQRLYLELLLIAEKDHIDAYVENTKNNKYVKEYDLNPFDLVQSFNIRYTEEGYQFWYDICHEATDLMETK